MSKNILLDASPIPIKIISTKNHPYFGVDWIKSKSRSHIKNIKPQGKTNAFRNTQNRKNTIPNKINNKLIIFLLL